VATGCPSALPRVETGENLQEVGWVGALDHHRFARERMDEVEARGVQHDPGSATFVPSIEDVAQDG
jgi:hypothetical protein